MLKTKGPYTVNVDWSEEDDAFVARVEELPSVITHGATLEEAERMIIEALFLHLDTLEKHEAN